MTIFCDVNTNGGYYIPPEYEHSKDDNSAAQSNNNTRMEEYNHDGNPEEYAERMAKEAAELIAKETAASSQNVVAMNEEYNMDGDMEEYAERMAKENAGGVMQDMVVMESMGGENKEAKNSEIETVDEENNGDGNIEENPAESAIVDDAATADEAARAVMEAAERAAEETRAAEAARAEMEARTGMGMNAETPLNNAMNPAIPLSSMQDDMNPGSEIEAAVRAEMEEAARGTAEAIKRAEVEIGAGTPMHNQMNPGAAMPNMQRFEMIPQGGVPKLFVPGPANNAPSGAPMTAFPQFRGLYYHPMHYHYYPHYPSVLAPQQPMSSDDKPVPGAMPFPFIAYHYSYKAPGSTSDGHDYRGSYFGYAKKTN